MDPWGKVDQEAFSNGMLWFEVESHKLLLAWKEFLENYALMFMEVDPGRAQDFLKIAEVIDGSMDALHLFKILEEMKKVVTNRLPSAAA